MWIRAAGLDLIKDSSRVASALPLSWRMDGKVSKSWLPKRMYEVNRKLHTKLRPRAI
jgi:hypothetical protein